MTNSRTFGRRTEFARNHRAIAEAPNNSRPVKCREERGPPFEPAEPGANHDDELLAWKRERRRRHGSPIPWQPILFTASISFFIASFVLPKSINSTVDWLLDLASFASLLAWLGGRRKRTVESRGDRS